VRSMTFREFAQLNRSRCEHQAGFNHILGSWSLSDWMTATMGELGEAANIAKKLNRFRDNVPGNAPGVSEEELRREFKREIADVFIYLDLLAQSQGFQLEDVAISKWDETSAKIGWDIRMGGVPE
jgi:NTP pyrophosphatase (non-canonical NTP hydrolase)